ncbi:permease-like cell division protein FtsX [Pseudactinotalea sp. HY158]|uniref:permease-like cell division protein FtsX n=1 Tax=Pseudactinotalea sp. HY158 TaxID=2654547 RepID=UPI00129CA822|nr:permease-like cell division protein FtsX [Pseudactinotalea sp. HY158]QGH70230.1 FtsX-like permease family protein [Pseudactinotalea sp. HY158]
MRVRFILSQIGSGLKSNIAMAISVVLVTFVSLAFVGSAALMQTQIGKLKDDWYDKVEVSVFMCPADSLQPSCAGGEATDDQLDDVRGILESEALAPYVSKVYLETKEEAYDNFVEQFGDEDWAQAITADQMQVSFRIKLVDPEQYEVIADELTGRTGVQQVQDQRKIFEPLFLVLNRATVLSVGLAVVMIVAAVLLITTTIRLSAMSRSRETSIMRLVGASNLFIQLPFMLEGAIAALVGAALAVGGLWGAVDYLQGWLADQITWVNLVNTADVWTIAPILVLVGILLAGVSSAVSLSRYTKV